MAVLKKITFGSSTTPIAQTVVTAASESVLSVTGTNTGLNDNADPTYELDINIDGTTITKSAAQAATYYTAEDEEVINGTKQVGDVKTPAVPAGLAVGTVPAAQVSVADSANKFTATDVEAALAELKGDIAEVVADGKSYSIVDDTANVQDLPTNVLKRYRLQETVGSTDTLVGTPIDILKDNSLLAAGLSTMDATWNGSAIVDGTGAEALVLVYKDANGTAQVIPINVSDFLKEAEFGDGLAVSNTGEVSAKLGQGLEFGSESGENKSINVKIDSTSADAEGFLSVGANGVKISGVQDAIDTSIAALDVTDDAAVAGQYVAAIEETDGVVAVKTRANVSEAVLNNYAKGASAPASTDVAAADTINQAIAKLEWHIDAVADAADDAHSVVEHASGNTHVTVAGATNANGGTTYTITESDIASAQDLSDEITRAQTAEGAIDTAVGLTKASGAETRSITPTTNYGTVSGTAATTVMGNMQNIDTALKNLSDTVGGISYSVSGTELTFYGIPAHS